MAFPATTSLAAYWRLDEASGSRLDSFGTSHLTDNNTVGSAAGKIGTAAQFVAASAERLSVASASIFQAGDTALTLAAWVNATTLAGSHRQIIAKHDSASYATSEYTLHYDNSASRFRVYFVNAGGTNQTTLDATALGAPSTGVWYFIIFWHDPTTDTIYIQVNDGTVNSVAHAGGSRSTATQVCIGSHSNNAQHWDGLIDEVSIWRRVLTAGERTDLYNGGSGVTYTPPQVQAPRSMHQRRLAMV